MPENQPEEVKLAVQNLGDLRRLLHNVGIEMMVDDRFMEHDDGMVLQLNVKSEWPVDKDGKEVEGFVGENHMPLIYVEDWTG